jgi:nucleoside-diphosphate-sugar epimerase
MRSYEDVPVAVLGATGFIGRWVTRKLSKDRARIYLVVRDAGSKTLLNEDGIQAETIEADLSIPGVLDDVFRRIRPAVTFNLAGYGVDPTETDEQTAWRINAGLIENLCESAARWKHPLWPYRQIVHAGSAAEYGDAGGDLREDGPASPTTLYGKSKLRATSTLVERCPTLGLSSITARLFTVYGPGEHPHRLLPSLLEASRTGLPLELSPATQKRDFTYVEDVAEGLLRVGLTAGETTIVNLATGRLTPVRTFVETTAKILRIPLSNLKFGVLPPGPHDMDHLNVSLTRLSQLLRWAPPTCITEGIRRSLEIGLPKKTATKNHA